MDPSNRLTVTAGGRFDYFNAGVARQTASAGRFVPARDVGRDSCLPCWKDWSIRLGGVLRPVRQRQDGAQGVGRQVPGVAERSARAQAVNPIRSAVGHADLDATSTATARRSTPIGNAQFNEIGPTINANFGLPAGSARIDPDTPRPTNWEETVSVQHELMPGRVGHRRLLPPQF